jgi:hypothetical protein
MASSTVLLDTFPASFWVPGKETIPEALNKK